MTRNQAAPEEALVSTVGAQYIMEGAPEGGLDG